MSLPAAASLQCHRQDGALVWTGSNSLPPFMQPVGTEDEMGRAKRFGQS